MLSSFVRYPLLILTAILFAAGARARAADLETIMNGPLANQNHLAPSGTVDITVNHPSHAVFTWLNFAALQDDLNIDLPPEGFTLDVEKKFAKQLLWIVPDPAHPEDWIPGEHTTMSASLYGGVGTGWSAGDGRSASKGPINLKYVGSTGLSGINQDFVHSTGTGALSRSISEGIWGEVGQDFPYGANRVFFSADRGTWTTWPDQAKERNALAGRQVPTRPAHYIDSIMDPTSASPSFQKLLRTKRDSRLRESMSRLPDALPLPPGFDPAASTSQKLNAGMFEYASRVAEQYAFEVANRFFKADLAPSNIDIDGRLLDYDSMTAQPHYIRLETPIGDKLGDRDGIEQRLIQELFESVENHAPPELRRNLPDRYEFYSYFEEQYAHRRARNFVELTGLPRDLVARLDRTFDGHLFINRLGALLDRVAFEGGERFLLTDTMPVQAPKYDLPRILVSLASRDPLDSAALDAVISSDIPDAELRATVVNDYTNLMKTAFEVARHDGVSLANLQRFNYVNAKIRNADIPELHRPALRKENERLVDEYLRTGNRSAIWDSMAPRIQRTRRVFKSEDPYQLVIMENRDPLHGMTERHLYDARTGKFGVQIRSRIKEGSAFFFGKRLSRAQLKNARLKFADATGKGEVSAKIGNDFVEFDIPSAEKPGGIELALPFAGENIRLTFPERHSIPAHPASPDPALLPPFVAGHEPTPKADPIKPAKAPGFWSRTGSCLTRFLKGQI